MLLQRLLRGLRIGELAFELRNLRVGLMHRGQCLIGLDAQFVGLRVVRLLALHELLLGALHLAVERIAAHARRTAMITTTNHSSGPLALRRFCAS